MTNTMMKLSVVVVIKTLGALSLLLMVMVVTDTSAFSSGAPPYTTSPSHRRTTDAAFATASSPMKPPLAQSPTQLLLTPARTTRRSPQRGTAPHHRPLRYRISDESRHLDNLIHSSSTAFRHIKGKEVESSNNNRQANKGDEDEKYVASTITEVSKTIAAQQDSPSSTQQPSSTVVAATFNLAKAMAGAGFLALPYGLAAASDFPKALWPANILLLILSTLSAYTFTLYGRLIHATQATSLGDLWNTIMKQERTKKIVSIANMTFLFGACLSYSIILGDAVSSMAATIVNSAGGGGGALARVASIFAGRRASILAMTGTVLLPLCNLKSLAALAPFSLLGVIASVIAVIFMGWRCPAIMKSSPYNMVGGAGGVGSLLSTLSANVKPQFGSFHNIYSSPASLILVAMAGTALFGHFCAPEFYHSLKRPNEQDVVVGGPVNGEAAGVLSTTESKKKTASSTLKRYNIMTGSAFLIVSILNALSMSFGFLTFGGNASGMILNNYSQVDWGAVVSRLLVILSITCSYPILLGSGRNALLEVFFPNKSSSSAPEEHSSSLTTKTTLGVLGVLTAISLAVKDAGFAVGFNGALVGTSLIYILPCMLFLKKSADDMVAGVRKKTFGVRLERIFCRFLVGFGAVSALIGGLVSIANSYFPHLLR